MKKILAAERLPCGCINGEALNVFISSCFREWGKYGDAEAVGFEEFETYRSEDYNSQVFIGKFGHSVMVTFRGFDKFHYILSDIDKMSVPFCQMNSGTRVNAIFLNAYLDVRSHVVQFIKNRGDITSIYFVGYSMGGAMATLAAAEIASKMEIMTFCYTFGSPMVGDRWFRKAYNNSVYGSFRYVIPNDPVPFYPSGEGYVHVCEDRMLGSRWGRFSLFMTKVKRAFLKIVGLGKGDIAYRMSKDVGVEGHELYNYAFMIRKYGDDLI